MALRVSQAYVSVLGKAPGSVRVGQVYLSVLMRRNTFNKLITQTMTLDSEFTEELEAGTINESFEDTLALSDNFYLPFVPLDYEDTLTLTDEFTIDPLAILITQSMSLSDEFTSNTPIVSQNFSDTLSFDETWIGAGDIELDFGDVMRYYNPLTSSYEGMDDQFTHSIDNASLTITQTLSFAQVFGLAYDLDFEDTLTFTEAFILPNTDTLDLDETWSVLNTDQISDTLDFEETWTVLNDRDNTVTQTLTFSENFKVVAEEDTCNYQLPNPPTLEHATLTLQYGMTTLVLRNPEFNDSYLQGFVRIQRETRGGSLKILRDPNWPKTTQLRYSIRNLPDADEILDFLQASLGQLITLTDHYNREWSGVILNPQTAVTDNGFCKVDFNLEFEGELV